MKKIIFFILIYTFSTLSIGQTSERKYRLSEKPRITKFTNSGWNGEMEFPGVYCATAPTPNEALNYAREMYNNNGIHLASILYPNNTLLTVATSIIPPGTSPEEETSRILASNQNHKKNLLQKIPTAVAEVSDLTTDFGRTVGLRINNIESDTPYVGPFPLEKKYIHHPDHPFLSMTVHRLFARGPDRFEVAAIQVLHGSEIKATEAEVYEHLTSMVEHLTKTLQLCTKEIPVRTLERKNY